MAEPRVTLIQVAERAGVSKTTAGYVLTGQDQKMRITEVTRDRVLRVAAEMNYRPNLMARSLRTAVSRPVAIISDTLVTEPYGGELLRGCLAAAAHHGRLTFIGETRRDPKLEAALIEEFLNEQVTDFVFATVYPRQIRVPRQLADARVVLLNCAASRDSFAAVLPDEVEAGRTAAGVLLDAGIRQGIHLVGDRAPHPYAPGRDRERGVRETLLAAGADLDGALDCAWEPESAYVAVSDALSAGLRPAALICMNDRVAFGAYQALQQAHRCIPHDTSVLCFEGSELATWLKPRLTSIDRGLYQMGWRAIDRLTGAEPPHGFEHLPLTLRARDSVARPNQS
nr:LacI family DNA-binding transcriptional regulator [uncultured Friedmanniella sp.]